MVRAYTWKAYTQRKVENYSVLPDSAHIRNQLLGRVYAIWLYNIIISFTVHGAN